MNIIRTKKHLELVKFSKCDENLERPTGFVFIWQCTNDTHTKDNKRVVTCVCSWIGEVVEIITNPNPILRKKHPF